MASQVKEFLDQELQPFLDEFKDVVVETQALRV